MIIILLALSSHLNNEKNLKESINIMQNNGHAIVIAEDIFRPTLFCANTDEYRLNSLIEAIYNKHDSVIWCIRGGYGSARILPELAKLYDQLHHKAISKHFIGFSDATAINLFLYQNLHWDKVIHGMNYNQISDAFIGKDFDIHNFALVERILDGTANSIVFNDLKALNQSASNLLNPVYGKITGGNLAILQTSIGTDWEVDTTNKILIIEDVGEAPYRIDRMLEHLYQANKLNSVNALVFGHFDKCEEETDKALKRIADLLDMHNIPVFKTELIGHGYHNYPFVYGANTEIISNGDGFLMEMFLS